MDSETRTTMNNYVDAEHICKFIDDHKVESLDSTISVEAERHLEQSFPLRNWSTIIDWDKVPSTMLEWNKVSDDEAVEWAMTTMIRQYSFGVLIYDSEQPCLIGSIDFMVRHLDELVWKAPGSRILFGANRDESGRVIFGSGVIEFNGKGELFATM